MGERLGSNESEEVMKPQGQFRFRAIVLACTWLTHVSAALGIPVTWTGNMNDQWNNPGNWNPTVVPCNMPPNAYNVIIDQPGAMVVLNELMCEVDSLTILNGATLRVIGTNLSIVTPQGLQLQGALLVSSNATINASFVPVTIGEGGLFARDPLAPCPDASSLIAGTITVLEGMPAGELQLDCDMTLSTQGDLILDGTNVSANSPSGAKVYGGLLPPILGLTDDSSGGVGGDIQILNAAQVTIDSTAFAAKSTARQQGPLSSPTLHLSGSFLNYSRRPDLFNAKEGRLVLGGVPGATQIFEVADVIPSSAAGLLLNNFAFGSIEILPGAIVDFVDEFDNDGLGQQTFESQFVLGTLSIVPSATVRVLGCGLFFGTFLDVESCIVLVKNGGAFQSIESLFNVVPTASEFGGWLVFAAMGLAGVAVLGRRKVPA